LEEAAAQADLLFLSHPIRRILDQIPLIAEIARPGALVTDAGSTKAQIARTAEAAFAGKPSEFLAGHPMAGKEGRGAAIADAELYRGATWALTPVREGEESEAAAELRGWLERIGARVHITSPEEHDRIVALTSHLPQALSTALAACLGDALHDSGELALAGGGLRDMTRLAGSSFAIWADIFETNRGNVRAALALLLAELEGFSEDLGSPAAASRFERAQRFHASTRVR
jgi:prephenate dehydrogenase